MLERCNHTAMPKARAVGWPSSTVLAWMRQQLVSVGGDANAIPDEPFRYWRLKEVTLRVGLSRSSIYRQISEGLFPRPVPLRGGITSELPR